MHLFCFNQNYQLNILIKITSNLLDKRFKRQWRASNSSNSSQEGGKNRAREDHDFKTFTNYRRNKLQHRISFLINYNIEYHF